MESNKNRFENLKLLFDNLLDDLNESNSVLLQQIDECRREIVVLNEKIDFYKEKTEILEEKIACFNVDEVLQNKDAVLENAIIADNILVEEVEQSEEDPLFIVDSGYTGDGEEEEVVKNKIDEDNEQEYSKNTGDLFKEDTEETQEDANVFKVIEINPVESAVNESQKKSEDIDVVLFPDLYDETRVLQVVTDENKEEKKDEVVKESAQDGKKLIMDTVRPDWYDWEVDYPAPYIEDIASSIGFNDRLIFLKELFKGDQEKFVGAVNDINKMELFKDAIDYIREHFPDWNDQSDEVYRFYMNVRRKLRK